MRTVQLFLDNSFAAGSPFDFTIGLPEDTISVYKKVKSVEIVSICIPKIKDEIVCSICVRGLDTKLHSNNPNIDTNFVVFFDNSLLNPGDFKPCDKLAKQKCVLSPPREIGHKLNVQIKTLDGQIVDSSLTGGEERVYMTLQMVVE